MQHTTGIYSFIFIFHIIIINHQRPSVSGSFLHVSISRVPYIASWSGWHSWSVCSRTCRKGLTIRLRHCQSWQDDKYKTTESANCLGSDRQIRVCEYKLPSFSCYSTQRKRITTNSVKNDDVAIQATKETTTTQPPPSSSSSSSTTTLTEQEIWEILMKEIDDKEQFRQTKFSYRRTDSATSLKQNKASGKGRHRQENEVILYRRKNRTTARNRRRKNRFKFRGYCGRCRKTRNRRLQFCQSNFVSHVRINSVEIINNETRYDVGIVSTYKNNIPLLHREYLWVTNVCKCPRLRVNREYIVMGHTDKRSSRELRLSLDSASFVRRFSLQQLQRIKRLRRKRRLCK